MSNKEILGLHRITKKHLKDLCRKHKLYQTPHLNDQLYLHFQGFQAIENLEEYSGLKCLWLESNAISEIQGLDCQAELKCLFLQNNLIKKIENLNSCSGLDTLNLASNHITKIENCGVDILPVLSTLNLSRNYLRSLEAVQELTNCKYLCSLDLSHNRIDDILVVKVFASMPELKVLVLQGNPVVSRVPQYRKTLILECKNLTYLDTRPVFPKDRACAEAWKRGGYEEERREHEHWVRMERKKIRDSVNSTLRLRQRMGAGDIQLLESTDEEDDNRLTKKPKRILEIEAPVRDDLEITGVVNSNDPEQKKSGESEIKVVLDEQETLQSFESQAQDISISNEEPTGLIQCDEKTAEAFEIDKEIDSKNDFASPNDADQGYEIKDEVEVDPEVDPKVDSEVQPERNFAVLDAIRLQIESKGPAEPAEIQLRLDPTSSDISTQHGENEEKMLERAEFSEKNSEEDHPEELKEENQNQRTIEETNITEVQMIEESTIEMKSASIFSERITINDKLESYRSFSTSTSSLSSDGSSDISSMSDEVFENSENERDQLKSGDNENLEHDLAEAIEQDSTEVNDAMDADFEVQPDRTFVIDEDSFAKSAQLETFDFFPKESTSNKCDISSESNFADSEPSYIEGTDTCTHKDSDFEDRMDYTVSTCEEFEDTRAEFDSTENSPKGTCKTLFRSRLGAFCSQDFELPDEEDSGLLNSFHSVSTDSEFERMEQAAVKLEDNNEVLVCHEGNDGQLTPDIDQNRIENVPEKTSPPHNEMNEDGNETSVDVTVSSNESENKTLNEIQAGYDDILSKVREVTEIETTMQSFVAEASVLSDESDVIEISTENHENKEEINETLPKVEEKMEEDSEKPPADNPEPTTWWEKTLAAARQEKIQTPIDSTSENEETEESAQIEDNIAEEQPVADNSEALSLLESILAALQKAMVQPKEEEPPADIEETSKSTSSNDTEYESDEYFDHEIASSPTIREVLTSFNEVAETLTRKNQQKAQHIQDLLSNPLTKTQESAETINAQVEEMKLKQRDRVSKMVDEVYAQREKYDDTLEVFDGRLMIVKRSTGVLEELPPLKKHMSCGTSTTANEQDDSGSDDYGTADDDEGSDNNVAIEQHTSCTKISRRTSSTETSEEEIVQQPEEDSPFVDSLQKIAKLHEDIDAEILPELGKWLEDASLIPPIEPTIKKKEGKEEAMLMKKMLAESSELQDDGGSEIERIKEADEAALDESAVKSETPE